MASVFVNSYKVRAAKGNIAFLTDTIKFALLNTTHVTNIDTQEFWSDVSANEVSGSGYTAGGVAATNKTVTLDTTNDRGVMDCDDPAWAAITAANIRYCAVYKDTGTPSTSPILGIIDLGGAQTQNGASFTVVLAATGLGYLG